MATMSRIADEILFTHIEVAIAIASEATLVGLGADDPRTQRNARVDLARHLVELLLELLEGALDVVSFFDLNAEHVFLIGRQK